MNKAEKMESSIFGPVPSRRLGRSLGINHIPSKTCTDWRVVEKLIKDDSLVELEYQGRKFYARKLPLYRKNP